MQRFFHRSRAATAHRAVPGRTTAGTSALPAAGVAPEGSQGKHRQASPFPVRRAVGTYPNNRSVRKGGLMYWDNASVRAASITPSLSHSASRFGDAASNPTPGRHRRKALASSPAPVPLLRSQARFLRFLLPRHLPHLPAPGISARAGQGIARVGP